MSPALPRRPPLPMLPMPRVRHTRLLAAAPAAFAAALLAACVGTSPPVQLYHLQAGPPVAVAAVTPSREHWQLMSPVVVPEYLDREAFLLPQGQTGLSAVSGHRWAESLRDSVPRVLRQDLARLLGEGQVWGNPAPPGLAITRQLRVEISALQADADRRAVTLQARWTIVDPAGKSAPRAASATLQVPSAGGDVDSLVAAHRLALWRLAERIAATS